MDPVQPPLPLASNFSFHPAAGIHSSILISESLLGFTVWAPRQNAGRSSNPPALPLPFAPPPPAAVKPPAGTACAALIVVLGSVSELRLSQDAASAGRAANRINATRHRPALPRELLIILSPPASKSVT